ncbi:iron-siderophore ABC transporter substrate-binding protein, partial [Streptomyces nigra]
MLLHTTFRKRPRRRTAALLSAAVLGAGLLAGCGSDDDTPGDDRGTTKAAAGAFPVTVEHAFGTTEITEAPERVVT